MQYAREREREETKKRKRDDEDDDATMYHHHRVDDDDDDEDGDYDKEEPCSILEGSRVATPFRSGPGPPLITLGEREREKKREIDEAIVVTHAL